MSETTLKYNKIIFLFIYNEKSYHFVQRFQTCTIGRVEKFVFFKFRNTKARESFSSILNKENILKHFECISSVHASRLKFDK